MAIVHENRCISMILMVPDVPDLDSSSQPIEIFDRSEIDSSTSTGVHPSMPIYHGSIVRIEQHDDDQTKSDLIVRVPNFQRSSVRSDKTDLTAQSKTKRRAPICPVLNNSNQQTTSESLNTEATNDFSSLHVKQLRVVNTNRLATGLRSLGRTFIHGCKSKQSSSITEINYISVLPDVEIMTEKLGIPIKSNAIAKHSILSSTSSKVTTPKVFFIKQKHFTFENEQATSNATADEQTNKENTNSSTSTKNTFSKKNNPIKTTSFLAPLGQPNDLTQQVMMIHDDNGYDREQQNTSITFSTEVEQQLQAISQLISDMPTPSIDADSISNNRYSTISTIMVNSRNLTSDTNIERASTSEQTSIVILPTSASISCESDNTTSKTAMSDFATQHRQPFHIQTHILQPDISVVRVGTTSQTIESNRLLPGEINSSEMGQTCIQERPMITSQIERTWHIGSQDDDDTLTELYEVTYQIDQGCQTEMELTTDESSAANDANLDSTEYKELASVQTTWSLLSTQNDYERIDHNNCTDQHNHQYQRIEQTNSKQQDLSRTKSPPVKSRSVDDLSRTSHDQTSTFQCESISEASSLEISPRHCTLQRSNSHSGFGIHVGTDRETRREHCVCKVEDSSPGEQAGLKVNDRILCINGTPVIDEEYTVVLQLIKHGLENDTLNLDVIASDAYEEFKSEIDQLYQ